MLKIHFKLSKFDSNQDVESDPLFRDGVVYPDPGWGLRVMELLGALLGEGCVCVCR